jgi:hypothetical protein
MKVTESLDAMLGRMTPRERRLFGVLVTAVTAALVAGVAVATVAFFGSIQEEIDKGRASMLELRTLAPRYRELSERRRALEEAIRGTKSTARSMVNDLLKKQTLSGEVPGALGDTMADIVSFEGKTTETPVETGKGGAKAKKATKGKGKEAVSGIVEIEQALEFKEVPSADLLAFLDAVEAGKDLLFVTKLELSRKFNDMSHVRAQVSVATYQFQGAEAEVAEPAPAATP